jgi:voltage-gated potassium channel Kch
MRTRLLPPRWFMLSSLFVAGLGLSLWGARRDDIGWSDALYLTVQMVFANVSFPVPPPSAETNWQFQVSRLVLPGVAAWAAIGFVLRLAGQHLWYLQLRFLRQPHVVFLGADRVASAIGSRLHRLNTSQKIIAVDLTTSREHINHLEENCGVRLIMGDATDPGLLRRLSLPRASAIYIFTGDDQRDLDVALEVIRIIPDRGRKPDLFIDIDDKSLVRTANLKKSLRTYQEEGGKLRWFSSHAQAARMLFLEHPPVSGPSIQRNGPLHIGLVGFGALAQEIVLQAVRHCVYIDEQPIVISIFAEDQAIFEQFLLRYPVLDHRRADVAYGGLTPLAKLCFHTLHPASPAPAVVREAMSLHSISKVYVTGATDQICQIAGFRFRQAMLATGMVGVETVCCLPGTHYLDLEDAVSEQLDSPENSGFYENIILFHATSAFFGAKEVSPGGDADSIGIRVDAAFRAYSDIKAAFSTIANTEYPLPNDLAPRKVWEQVEHAIQNRLGEAQTAWETQLSEDFRWSSRHSGDHIFVKLRELGFSLKAGEGGVSNDLLEELRKAIETNMEALKRMEHRRFCLERLLDGWLYYREKKRSTALNDTLLPYDDLPSEEKLKDEVIIRAIPLILRDNEIASRYALTRVV